MQGYLRMTLVLFPVCKHKDTQPGSPREGAKGQLPRGPAQKWGPPKLAPLHPPSATPLPAWNILEVIKFTIAIKLLHCASVLSERGPLGMSFPGARRGSLGWPMHNRCSLQAA